MPAARHAIGESATVVVSTATIALQRQLIDRDLPRLAEAIAPVLGREPVFAILKGRRNYLCLQRLRGGPADDEAEALFDPRRGLGDRAAGAAAARMGSADQDR